MTQKYFRNFRRAFLLRNQLTSMNQHRTYSENSLKPSGCWQNPCNNPVVVESAFCTRTGLFHRASVLVGLVLCHLVGCGSGTDVDLVSVSGRVTLDGEPVVGIPVLFTPQATTGSDRLLTGAMSYGVTDESGRYKLRQVTVGRRPGVPAGQCKVRIGDDEVSMALKAKKKKDVAEGESANHGRRERHNASNSPTGLPRIYLETFVVPEGGTEEADFTLMRN